mgnify:CR=1 FL=1
MCSSESDHAQMRHLSLRPLQNCSAQQTETIRQIRNCENVRATMYSDHMISATEHQAWLLGLKNDATSIVFAVLREDEVPVGLVSVTKIDVKHKKADWAFYLDVSARGGLGAALEYMVIEYVFERLGLYKLNCEVLETNEAVIKMHQKFAFEIEGLRRSNIEKNGARVGVVFLGLTREDWISRQFEIRDRYSSVLARFDLRIDAMAS